MQRKRVAVIASYLYPGQYRGILRYGQQAGWICQRMDRDTLPRLNSWSPDGLLFQIDEFDTPLMDPLVGEWRKSSANTGPSTRWNSSAKPTCRCTGLPNNAGSPVTIKWNARSAHPVA